MRFPGLTHRIPERFKKQFTTAPPGSASPQLVFFKQSTRKLKILWSGVWIMKLCVLSLPALASLTPVQSFCLEYIGMAAGIGYTINIPRLIQVFACNAYQHGRHLRPLLFDRSFLMLLDSGPSGDEGPLAESYDIAWWTSAQAAVTEDVLCFANLERCLAYHRAQTGGGGVNPASLAKTKYTWSPDMSYPPRTTPQADVSGE